MLWQSADSSVGDLIATKSLRIMGRNDSNPKLFQLAPPRTTSGISMELLRLELHRVGASFVPCKDMIIVARVPLKYIGDHISNVTNYTY